MLYKNMAGLSPSFIVYLPKYNYRIGYDYESWIQTYPSSLITLALQSGEQEIPLENPSVTPELLQLLQHVITTGQYPYIPIQYLRAIDYLGIDFPTFVYDPRYEELLKIKPNLDWNQDYAMILKYAVDNSFPELTSYIFSITNPEEHKLDDINLLNYILMPETETSPENEEIALILLKRGQSERYVDLNIVSKGYDKLFRSIYETHPTAQIAQLLPGFVRTIAQHPLNFQGIAMILLYLRSVLVSDNPPPDVFTVPARTILEAQGAVIAFYDAYTGNIEEFKGIRLEEPGTHYIVNLKVLGPSLIYTTLFTHHFEMFDYIMNRLAMSDIPDYQTTVYYFTETYFKHPELITPEELVVVKPYINPLDLRSYSYILSDQGYPELARLLLS